ncbi:MAG: DUF3782 domain-containing protein, partial [Deltaproteobacteria bacterium]|nr:DUF3782 domain-containing protein [Deltaproteobacteria bacterium]
RQRPEFRYKVQDIVLEALPLQKEFKQWRQEMKELREEGAHRIEAFERRTEEYATETRVWREDSNRRFEEQEAETRTLREDSNRRFEEQAAETRTLREDLIAEMKALREDSNRRFEEQAAETRSLREDTNRRFEDSDRRMAEGFKEVNKSIDRLGQRWGIRNESIFRQTIATLLEKSFDSTVESRWIEGEQYDVVIANGEHILVEITASAGPKTQKTLERKRRIYTETIQAPERVILAVGSIHSHRARALEEAGFEVLEPEEEDIP